MDGRASSSSEDWTPWMAKGTSGRNWDERCLTIQQARNLVDRDRGVLAVMECKKPGTIGCEIGESLKPRTTIASAHDRDVLVRSLFRRNVLSQSEAEHREMYRHERTIHSSARPPAASQICTLRQRADHLFAVQPCHQGGAPGYFAA